MELIDTYRGLLKISKHAIDDGFEVQADVMERISTAVAKLERHVALKADELKRAEGLAYLRIKDGGATDKMAEAGARGDVERMRALNTHLDAKQELSEWQGLYEAWKSRGYALTGLGNAFQASYFTRSATGNIDRSQRPHVERTDYSVHRRSQHQADPDRAIARYERQQGEVEMRPDAVSKPRRRVT